MKTEIKVIPKIKIPLHDLVRSIFEASDMGRFFEKNGNNYFIQAQMPLVNTKYRTMKYFPSSDNWELVEVGSSEVISPLEGKVTIVRRGD